ncbi:aldehyde dehydrogenase family protein [Streptomyces sp. NPDC058741]|uniref:aldehyde dehydrogenase family protein n=1 Tax=Streptomyces sp. NPDC058741 TaxID=3346620 RepID=UPI003680AF4C
MSVPASGARPVPAGGRSSRRTPRAARTRTFSHAAAYGHRELRRNRQVNSHAVDDPTSPFGGFKMSGYGREFGVHGLNAYLETRTVFGD